MRSEVQVTEAKNQSYFFAFNIKLALKVHEGWVGVDQKVKRDLNSPFPKGSRPAIRWDRSSLGACGLRSSLPLGAELKSEEGEDAFRGCNMGPYCWGNRKMSYIII